MRAFLAAIVLASCLALCPAQVPKPDPALLQKDLSTLDAMGRQITQTAQTHHWNWNTPEFQKYLAETEGQVAKESGVRIIHAVLTKIRPATSDGAAIVFIPLIEALPYEEATSLLEAYKESGDEPDRSYASDYLGELKDFHSTHASASP